MEKVFKIAITCLCLLSHPYRNISATAVTATARLPHYRFRDVLKLQTNHKPLVGGDGGGGGDKQSRWWSEEDYSLPHRRIPMHNDFKP
ncbi:hypothetical protein L1987_65770 [Smallanthus sonchifolius]|uniref:Uncharacterized protein n=1 Tax=Smallanthus sonchifolius TaxID=185202 RepID=A0ACB9BVG5_9ASTR|nr:hypothetical protein L1987_65770 [Smallanthus sonchifolius]